jgi:hypothetical protein
MAEGRLTGRVTRGSERHPPCEQLLLAYFRAQVNNRALAKANNDSLGGDYP